MAPPPTVPLMANHRYRSVRSLLLATLACVFAVSACSFAGESGESSGKSKSVSDVEQSSPISEALGISVWSGAGDRVAEVEQARLLAEDMVVLCMRNLGFDGHQPVSFVRRFQTVAHDFEYGSDEWVRKYGFGLSTLEYPEGLVGNDLVGYIEDGDGEEPDDPNEPYVESLTDAERAAYSLALHGEQPDPDTPLDQAGEFLSNRANKGCRQQSYDDASNGRVDAFYAAFEDQLAQIVERVEADPEVLAFRARVSTCVSESGLSFDTPAAAQAKILAALAEFNLRADQADETRERLGKVQSDEVALAVAVLECGGGPVASAEFMNRVRPKYEDQFLAENADEISSFD